MASERNGNNFFNEFREKWQTSFFVLTLISLWTAEEKRILAENKAF